MFSRLTFLAVTLAFTAYGQSVPPRKPDAAKAIPRTPNGRPHPPASVRSWSGDAVGRWEGDTLVVDTANFTSKFNSLGISDRFHLIERCTRRRPVV
jgi:hypothetical protein